MPSKFGGLEVGPQAPQAPPGGGSKFGGVPLESSAPGFGDQFMERMGENVVNLGGMATDPLGTLGGLAEMILNPGRHIWNTGKHMFTQTPGQNAADLAFQAGAAGIGMGLGKAGGVAARGLQGAEAGTLLKLALKPKSTIAKMIMDALETGAPEGRLSAPPLPRVGARSFPEAPLEVPASVSSAPPSTWGTPTGIMPTVPETFVEAHPFRVSLPPKGKPPAPRPPVAPPAVGPMKQAAQKPSVAPPAIGPMRWVPESQVMAPPAIGPLRGVVEPAPRQPVTPPGVSFPNRYAETAEDLTSSTPGPKPVETPPGHYESTVSRVAAKHEANLTAADTKAAHYLRSQNKRPADVLDESKMSLEDLNAVRKAIGARPLQEKPPAGSYGRSAGEWRAHIAKLLEGLW